MDSNPLVSVPSEKLIDVTLLQKRLREFATARDWEQFHTPKNLAVAISVEAAELLQVFQWLSDSEAKDIKHSPGGLAQVEAEISDVFIYLSRLADVLGIDIDATVREKLRLNEQKYPVELSRGSAVKYSRRPG